MPAGDYYEWHTTTTNDTIVSLQPPDYMKWYIDIDWKLDWDLMKIPSFVNETRNNRPIYE